MPPKIPSTTSTKRRKVADTSTYTPKTPEEIAAYRQLQLARSDAQQCGMIAIQAADKEYYYETKDAFTAFHNELLSAGDQFSTQLIDQDKLGILTSDATKRHQTVSSNIQKKYDAAVRTANIEYNQKFSNANSTYATIISSLARSAQQKTSSTRSSSLEAALDSVTAAAKPIVHHSVQPQSAEPISSEFVKPQRMGRYVFDQFYEAHDNNILPDITCISNNEQGYSLRVFNTSLNPALLYTHSLVFALTVPVGSQPEISSLTANIQYSDSRSKDATEITTFPLVSLLKTYADRSHPSLQLFYVSPDDIKDLITVRLRRKHNKEISFTISLSVDGEEELIPPVTTNFVPLFSKIPATSHSVDPVAGREDIQVAGKRTRDTSDSDNEDQVPAAAAASAADESDEESSTSDGTATPTASTTDDTASTTRPSTPLPPPFPWSSTSDGTATSTASATEAPSIARPSTPEHVSRPPVTFAWPPITPERTATSADDHSRSPGRSSPLDKYRTTEPLGLSRAYSRSPGGSSAPLSRLALSSPQDFLQQPQFLDSPGDNRQPWHTTDDAAIDGPAVTIDGPAVTRDGSLDPGARF